MGVILVPEFSTLDAVKHYSQANIIVLTTNLFTFSLSSSIYESQDQLCWDVAWQCKIMRHIVETSFSTLQEAVGSIASTDLQKQGAKDKEAAVAEMREAQAHSDPSVNKNPTLGKVEQAIGSAAGCEGLKDEGQKRQT